MKPIAAILLLLFFGLSAVLPAGAASLLDPTGAIHHAAMAGDGGHADHSGHGARDGHGDEAGCTDGGAACCCPVFSSGCQGPMARADESAPNPHPLAASCFAASVASLSGSSPQAELPPPRA